MAKHVWRDEINRGKRTLPPSGINYNAPYPLPYVNRDAIKRVRDRVPTPTQCHYCMCEVELINNEELYGSERGKWPFMYVCTGCKARVSVHPETALAMGILADEDTRTARRRVKPVFQNATKVHFSGDRSLAYAWLAKHMGIPLSRCHFAMFDEDDCYKAYRLLFELFMEGHTNIVV